MTVMEFNSDNRVDDVSAIVLPDSFQEVYLNFDFLEGLLIVL